MKKFNINNYPGNYAMHCKTEEEAKDFCRVMHEAGREWIDHMLYTQIINWNTYEEKTIYLFNEGTFGTFDTAENEDYTVLNWSDFMQHEFTKADLRDGMVGITRNGTRYVFLNGFFMHSNQREYLCSPERMNDDLTIRNVSPCDIVRICKSKARIFSEYFMDKNLETIWQRPEVTEMTMDEIKEKLGITGELRIKEG